MRYDELVLIALVVLVWSWPGQSGSCGTCRWWNAAALAALKARTLDPRVCFDAWWTIGRAPHPQAGLCFSFGVIVYTEATPEGWTSLR
jgi:hypothetical protein